jgi:uncharacterized protein (DUF1684 family)
MKLSQKRTCNGCKALNVVDARCDLGAEIAIDFSDADARFKKYRPKQKCYKPTTNNEWVMALELAGKRPCKGGAIPEGTYRVERINTEVPK